MVNEDVVKDEKTKELLKIVNISEDEYEKLDYKEKQKYFKAKNKLGKVFFKSVDKTGKSRTYKKPKFVPQIIIKK